MSEIIVTDKLNLTYLQAKGIYPIVTPKRIDKQVRFTYNNDEQFQQCQLSFMKDKNFQDYKMAEKIIEEMLRSTK
jgi:cytidylate kinase